MTYLNNQQITWVEGRILSLNKPELRVKDAYVADSRRRLHISSS